jgi:hypothetical protein
VTNRNNHVDNLDINSGSKQLLRRGICALYGVWEIDISVTVHDIGRAKCLACKKKYLMQQYTSLVTLPGLT